MMDRSYKNLLKMHRYPHTWCPGCGIGAVMKNVAAVLNELGWNYRNTAVVSGIGCSGRMASYMNFDAVHTPHGRALTSAEAIKTVRPDLHVVVLSGDGDLASIGGNHLLHTSRRNANITVFCNNNEIYGLTGGQAGPTTPRGTKTITSPRGRGLFTAATRTPVDHAGALFLRKNDGVSFEPPPNLHSRGFALEGLQLRGHPE